MIGLLIALVLLFGAAGIVTAVTFYAQLQKMQALNVPTQPIALATNDATDPESRNPLQGLRIALSISQDHPHAAFIDVLKEELFAADATDVDIVAESDSSQIWDGENAPDIHIKGNVVCNGYAEIYYTGEFSCSNRDQSICTLIEKPPHGDRPINLAKELVARIKRELTKIVDRDERRRALRELGN